MQLLSFDDWNNASPFSFVQVPYMQIRENNWTLNTNLKGKWNVRFDL